MLSYPFVATVSVIVLAYAAFMIATIRRRNVKPSMGDKRRQAIAQQLSDLEFLRENDICIRDADKVTQKRMSRD